MREFLKKFATDDFLKNEFKYNFSEENGIFTASEKRRLADEDSIYKKNITLKFIIQNKISSLNQPSAELNKIYFWIINTWGGIGSL